MANKKIPLPKAPGTDSHGNINVGSAKVLDLSDYDDLFGPSPAQKKKSGWEEFKGGYTDSLSNRLNTKDVVRNFLRSAAPDGISSLFGAYDDLKGSALNIKDSLERTNASDLDYIARHAKNYLPQLKDYVPESVYDKIDAGLESKIDDYKYAIESNRSQTAIRAQNKSAYEDNIIQTALDNIALVSKQNHNKTMKADSIRDKQTRAERGLRDIVQTKRFDFMSKAMGMAVDNLGSIRAYNEQFDAGIKRKGLELQFRTYMGIKDLVKLAETSLQIQVQTAEQLVRNTGIPDYQKGSQADLRKFQQNGQSRGGGLGSALSKVGNRTLQQYLGNFGSNVENNITKSLGRQLADIVQAARMGENAPGLWDQRYSMAGSLAGSMTGNVIQSHLLPMLGRKLRPTATRMMNRYGGGKHNQAGYFMDNIPAFAQEWVNNSQNQYGWRGMIRDMVAPNLPQFSLNDRVTHGNYQTIDQQASFNQMTQRSITEVIPGFLARAVQELRMIRTGRDDIARESFDITTGKFVTEESANDNLLKRIIPETAIRSASSTINDVLNQFDDEGKLSPAARKAMAERMLREASNNKRFNPEQYLKSRGFKDGTSSDVTDEIGRFFREKYEFDKDGKMKDTADNHNLRQNWSQAFLDIRSISRDPYKEIERLIESGRTEPLRMMGIITTEGNQDKINYDRIWEILRSGVTDTNPWSPNGSGFDPNKDDMSGTVGHKDFMGPAFKGQAHQFGMNMLARTRERFAPTEKSARDKTARRIRELRAKYGNNHAKIAEELAALKERTGETLAGAYGQGTDFTSSLMGGFDPTAIKDKAKSAYDKAREQMTGVASASYVPTGMDKLTDLYSKFDPSEPVIKAIDFVKGNLVDLNTKQIITKPSDITGEVINLQGLTVVSARDVATGLYDKLGDKVINPVLALGQQAARAIANRMGLQAGSPAQQMGQDNPPENEPQDLSLSPGEDVVITARGIQNGEYFNRSTGKLVTSMADLDGDIVDKDGNVVVTAQEVREGLYNYKTGKAWKLVKGAKNFFAGASAISKLSSMTATQMGFHAIKFMGKAAIGLAAKAVTLFIDNQNAYLPDSEDPVFTRRQLKAGEYFDEKGKVIENFVDCYGLIYGKDGEPVLAQDKYGSLMNYDGSKHQLAKNSTIWGKTIKRGLRSIRNAYKAASIRYWKWLGRKAVGGASWAGRKLLGGSASLGGKLLGKAFEKADPEAMSNPTNMILAQILQQLQANEPPPAEREGSWKDKAKKKAAALGDMLQNKGVKEGGKQGLLGSLIGGLGKLMGGGKSKDEDDDDGFGLDDAADIADIADSVGDAKERRDRKKGRMRGRGKAGRMARMGNYLKNSRMGQWAARGGAALMETGAARGALSIGARVAAPLLTGLAAIMSAPAWLVVAGVAVVGAGAYMGYRAYKAAGDFKYLRMMQYGIKSTGNKLDILKLEAVLEKYTDKGSDNPHMELNSNIAKEVLDIMGIDPKDEPRLMVFSRWMEQRFKPVYLAYCKGLGSIGKKDVKLADIDDEVPDELKADLLKAVTFPFEGETPYMYTDNPFSTVDKLPDTIPEIKEQTEKLTEKFKGAKEEADKDKAKAQTEGKDGKPEDVAKMTAAAMTGTAVAAADLMNAQKGQGATPPPQVTNALTNVKNAVKVAALSGSVGMMTPEKVTAKKLTSLQSIRMRAYGLQTLSIADIESLLTLEYVYSRDLVMNDDTVDFMGDFTVFVREAGTYLGISTGANDPSRLKLSAWLANRFAPAFRAYWGAAMNRVPSAQLNSIESQLKKEDKIAVANAVMGATNSSDDSIWEVPSIFEITGALSDLRTLAEADLKHLKETDNKDIADSPTQKASDQVAGKTNASMGGSFMDSVTETAKSAWDATKSTAASAYDTVSGWFGGNSSSGKPGEGNNAPYVNNSGRQVQSSGLVLSDVAKGNGGKWEDVPMPTANGTAKGAAKTFEAAAAMVGVPVDLLFVIAGIESGYKYDIQAKPSVNKRTGQMSKGSSAYGWFQFLNATWDSVYIKVQELFGAPPDDSARSMRKDPRLQALAGALFMKGNYEALKKALGRPVSDTDIYIAHFLGLGGARKFLTADPNAFGYQVFPKESESNITIFYVGGEKSQPRTIGQIYKLFDDKIAKYRQGGKNAAPTDVPETVGEKNSPAAIQEAQAEASQTTTEIAPDPDKTKKDEVQESPGSMIAGTAPGATSNTSLAPSGMPTGNSQPGASQNSGGGTVDQNRTNSEEAALQAQQRREQELRQSSINDAKVDKIRQDQLDRLTEIRDYMKLMYEQGGGLGRRAANDPQGGNNTTAGNGTNNSMNSPIQNRTAQHRQSPMKLN